MSILDTTTLGRRYVAAARRFHRREDGALTVFTLFIFVMMLMIGGMAVDLMRFEMRRTTLQNTIDSAVLAAADLDQELVAEDVVKSYFEKRGFDPDTVSVIDNPSYVADNAELVGREVRANSNLQLNTFFMHMLGINTLQTPATGSAIENIQNVEISLVLDISGSMRFDKDGNTPSEMNAKNRINDLKDAVVDFVHAVLQVTCEDEINKTGCVQSPNTASTTINIIPYAGHVNPGPHLFSLMGGNRWHEWSSCKEVTDADFDDADLPNASGDQLPHFMKWSISEDWMNWGWCPKDDAGIMVAENDFEVITDFVRNIRMHDGTATHVGMKYGVALLNPSSRDEFQALNAITVNGRKIVQDEYKNRPADWDDDVVKYVVLMTDGKTTDQFRPKVGDLAWSYGPINDALTDYVAFATGDGEGEGEGEGEGSMDPPSVSEDLAPILNRFGSFNANFEPNSSAVVEQGYPSNSVYTENGKTHDANRNNGHITAMCNEAKKPVMMRDQDGNIIEDATGTQLIAKEDRITVFTIAFLAPQGAQDLMKACASSESHYFPIEKLNISTAFEAIAKTINQLRLTQ